MPQVPTIPTWDAFHPLIIHFPISFLLLEENISFIPKIKKLQEHLSLVLEFSLDMVAGLCLLGSYLVIFLNGTLETLNYCFCSKSNYYASNNEIEELYETRIDSSSAFYSSSICFII